MNSKDTKDCLREIEQIGDLKLHEDPDYMFDLMKTRIVHDIRLVMERDGVSISDLARKLNKSRQYISKILSEKSNLSIKSMLKIAIALDCKLEIRLEKK